MRYCVDTGFILALFAQDEGAVRILDNAKHGKDWILIPLVVFAESVKKLSQFGTPQNKVYAFFDEVESSEKIHLVYPDKTIAAEAARVSLTYAVPLLDAFVAATAKIVNCDALLALDSDFDLLTKKRYIKIQAW